MTSAPKVLITGVTGQDGSNMTRFLLKNTNCIIYGGVRRLSVSNHENIMDIENKNTETLKFEQLNYKINEIDKEQKNNTFLSINSIENI